MSRSKFSDIRINRSLPSLPNLATSVHSGRGWGFFASLLLCLFALNPFLVQAQGTTPDDLLAGMTLEQKVGQMFMFSFFGYPMNEPARRVVEQWQPGFVALFPSNLGNPDDITRLTNGIQQALVDSGGVPAFIGVDQEGGIIAHLKDGFTTFPVPMVLTATQDTDLAYRYGAAMAGEMRAVGINLDFAPVADLNTNRNNPIIGRRSFGDNPAQVAPIVAALIEGMQASGVLATAKHFPGHGDTSEDSHTTLPTVGHDLTRLMATELVPFQAAVDAQVGMVMVAHIYYPALDPNHPGLPASLSNNVVTKLLRDQLGYTGLSMPDAMDMDAIDTVYSPEEAALKAIEAGHDVIVLGAHVGPDIHARAMQGVVDAVNRGELDVARVDSSVRRILTMKQQFGLLDGWQPLDATTAAERILLANSAAIIDEVFRAGVTVVYDDKGLIPLQGSIAIIYPGSQPSLWNACHQRDGLQPLAVSQSPGADEISGAKWVAGQAETVVVFTQDAETNAQQQALVAALPPEKTIVVALQSPYDLLAIPRPAAYVTTYSPLKPAYQAVCDVLFGVIPARGQAVVQLP
jgi:beta-N-acetylhexosaminidase